MGLCDDCKYCVALRCTHPNAMDCNHCSLWTPNWYGKDEKSLLYADLDEIIDATDGKGDGE